MYIYAYTYGDSFGARLMRKSDKGLAFLTEPGAAENPLRPPTQSGPAALSLHHTSKFCLFTVGLGVPFRQDKASTVGSALPGPSPRCTATQQVHGRYPSRRGEETVLYEGVSVVGGRKSGYRRRLGLQHQRQGSEQMRSGCWFYV